MIFVLLGPSGCGKGTQAKILAQKYNLTHISTGALLRREFERGTPEGIEAHQWWGQGHWAPTKIVEPLLMRELEKHPQGNFVIEGWPRLSEQKEILDKFLTNHHLKIDRVFYLETPVEESRRRIAGRIKEAQNRGQAPRPDETPAVIEERLRSFGETIGPILDYYRQKGILVVIDNRPSIEEVALEIAHRIDG